MKRAIVEFILFLCIATVLVGGLFLLQERATLIGSGNCFAISSVSGMEICKETPSIALQSSCNESPLISVLLNLPCFFHTLYECPITIQTRIERPDLVGLVTE